MTVSASWLLSLWSSSRLWFNTLNPSVQAALLGVTGTIITAFAALLVLGGNLWFSRWKHLRDAEMTLRKDVYLSAADAMAEVMQFLTVLPQRQTKLADGNSAILKFAGVFGKIQAISTQRTLKAVLAVQKGFSKAIMEIGYQKNELDRLQREIDMQEQEVKMYSNYIQDLEKRKFWAYHPEQEPELSPQIVKEIEGVSRLLKTSEGCLNELHSKIQQDALLAHRISISNIVKLGELNLEVILEFRRELKAKVDAEWYRREVKTMLKSVNQEAMERLREIEESSKIPF